jgi:hypothetical protein
VIWTLLALCSRAEGHPGLYDCLREKVNQFGQWSDLPHQEVLVLKGAALAHLVYPQPGLRPMRDLDILVKKPDARRAQRILLAIGFDAPLPPVGELPAKHLLAARRYTGGLLVTVEVHHSLFDTTSRLPSMGFEDLIGSAMSFLFDGKDALTLSHEDMLWHVYQHTIGLPLLFRPLRLVGLADIVSIVEKFVNDIDWDVVRRKYPQVLNVLPLLHSLLLGLMPC